MKPSLDSGVDVIVCWPNSMDYPVWRAFMVKHRELFGRIFIVFTETNKGIDYSDFVKSALDFPEFCFLYPAPLEKGQDWRDQAVNMALDKSKSNWIWFTEQDLLITSPAFWAGITLAMAKFDAIGYREGTRLHPSNLWVKREFINKTKRFFGIVPDQMDHFGKFHFSLRHSGANIYEMKYKGGDNPHDTFYHMNGLSHNLSLIQDGEKPVYKEEEFANYLMLTLQVDPIDERYKQMVETYLKGYKADENTN